LIFKRFLIDKIQDKNKVFQRQISNELKVKVKVKWNQNNVNTISYNQRRKKFDIFLETKIIWAFMPTKRIWDGFSETLCKYFSTYNYPQGLCSYPILTKKR
jgi:hypothetical protein